jgi:4-hydroxymandelate oxidase
MGRAVDLTALLTLADFEHAAEATMDGASRAYLAGGAGSERSVEANLRAFDGLWLRPTVLGTTDRPDTTLTLFGQSLSSPVLLGPTSPQRLFHDDAELATARAADAMGTVSIVSTDGHYPFREVAAAGGKSCWFQLYPYRSMTDVEGLLEMAEDAGATGIVLTVDAFHRPQRLSTQRARFALPASVDLGTLRECGVLDGAAPAGARIDRIPLSWADVRRIRSTTTLPLLVKGVLRPDDAQRCVDVGLDGIIVSNHGGRQLDGVVPALAALEPIAARVGDACVLLVDGGVRTGGDVMKALALGATAVCIARPYLWGLRLGGRCGVEAVLSVLQQEIEDALRQLGLSCLAEVRRDCVVRTAELTGACRP